MRTFLTSTMAAGALALMLSLSPSAQAHERPCHEPRHAEPCRFAPCPPPACRPLRPGIDVIDTPVCRVTSCSPPPCYTPPCRREPRHYERRR